MSEHLPLPFLKNGVAQVAHGNLDHNVATRHLALDFYDGIDHVE